VLSGFGLSGFACLHSSLTGVWPALSACSPTISGSVVTAVQHNYNNYQDIILVTLSEH